MNRRGDNVPLGERIHGTPAPTSPVKPCWVTDRHGHHPGLLLQWRQTASGWQGRVVRPVLARGDWIVVEEWMPAELHARFAREALIFSRCRGVVWLWAVDREILGHGQRPAQFH